jgi:hypothetical protein
MNRQYVSSSRIVSIGWESDTLEVEFKDGSIYQYFNVSITEYNNFKNSSSLGSSLYVLDKQHTYKRIN